MEDVTIPWEGTRLLNVVRDALHDVKRDQSVTLVARVSEGPEVRQTLQTQLMQMLAQHGIDSSHAKVIVLCAYKQGYSWLMDEFAPELEGRNPSRESTSSSPKIQIRPACARCTRPRDGCRSCTRLTRCLRKS